MKKCTTSQAVIKMENNITSISFSSIVKNKSKITTPEINIINIFFAIEYLFLKVRASGEHKLIILDKIKKSIRKNAQFNLSIFTFRKVDFRIIFYQ